MLRTGITVDYASSGVILRLALQRPLCNLCREVYNETKAEYFLSVFAVALLAEGVDRNDIWNNRMNRYVRVALLAEGVDRNLAERVVVGSGQLSPSSRRAWIEISKMAVLSSCWASVALLAEGVDRNTPCRAARDRFHQSPSSRRAWIEMPKNRLKSSQTMRRPPRGGRG